MTAALHRNIKRNMIIIAIEKCSNVVKPYNIYVLRLGFDRNFDFNRQQTNIINSYNQ